MGAPLFTGSSLVRSGVDAMRWVTGAGMRVAVCTLAADAGAAGIAWVARGGSAGSSPPPSRMRAQRACNWCEPMRMASVGLSGPKVVTLVSST